MKYNKKQGDTMTINIRQVKLEDTEALLKIYSYYVLNTSISFEYDVPSLEEFKQRIIKIAKTYPYLVAIKNDELLGYAYATSYKERVAYNWTVETNVYVKASYHGTGIGKLLYTHLEQALKDMHIVNMLACISYPNPKSIDFHTKYGFVEVGHFHKVGYKFNEWRDILWMQKSIQ